MTRTVLRSLPFLAVLGLSACVDSYAAPREAYRPAPVVVDGQPLPQNPQQGRVIGAGIGG